MRLLRNAPLTPQAGSVGGLEPAKFNEYTSASDFPATGQQAIIYLDKSSSPYSAYIWDTDVSDYVQFGGSGGGGSGGASIVYEASVADLPAVGNSDTLYVITGGTSYEAYVWSADDLAFKQLSSGGATGASVSGEPNGFDVLSSDLSLGALTGYNPTYTFSANETVFTLTPNTEQNVYVNSTKFIKDSPESVTVNASGLSYIYYDNTGTLSVKSSYFDLKTEAPVAYVYRHNNKAIVLAEERHGLTMDWATHEYLHNTRGAAYASGFAITNYDTTGDGTLDSDLTIGLSGGSFFDEDLKINIAHGAGGYFTQPLNGIAQIPVFYRSNNGWTADQATNYPLKSATTMQYNTVVAGNWTLANINNNAYGVMFIVATNNLLAPVIAIMGQAQYSEQAAADAAFYEALDFNGFPIYEFRALYKLVYRTRNTYTNARKAVLRQVHDLRRDYSSILAAPIAITGPTIKAVGRVATDGTYEQIIDESAVTATNTISLIYENDGPIISTSVKDRVVGDSFTVKFASLPPTGSYLNYQII